MGNQQGYWNPAALAVCALALAGMLLTGAVGCGDSDERSTTDADAILAEAEAMVANAIESDTIVADTSKCKHVKTPKSKGATYDAPAQTVRKGEKLTAVVETTCGTFEIKLDAKRYPTTVNSFVFLARQGFYEGVAFDEAAAGTYLHGGDPPGDAVGPGYTIKGEVPKGVVYRHRMIAMGHPGKGPIGEAGSEFFVVLGKPWIDTSSVYPPLGKVSKGYGVLRLINALGPPDRFPGPDNIGTTGAIENLRRPVLIEEISIERR